MTRASRFFNLAALAFLGTVGVLIGIEVRPRIVSWLAPPAPAPAVPAEIFWPALNLDPKPAEVRRASIPQ
jgi:hypothetical protein